MGTLFFRFAQISIKIEVDQITVFEHCLGVLVVDLNLCQKLLGDF